VWGTTGGACMPAKHPQAEPRTAGLVGQAISKGRGQPERSKKKSKKHRSLEKVVAKGFGESENKPFWLGEPGNLGGEETPCWDAWHGTLRWKDEPNKQVPAPAPNSEAFKQDNQGKNSVVEARGR